MSPSSPHPVDDHQVGLLDAPAPPVEAVELSPGGDEDGQIEPGAFPRLAVALLSFLALMAVPYLVAPLAWAQPWPLSSSYVPFWNLVGREFMGEGAAAQADEAQMAEFEALARAAEGAGPGDDAALVDRPLQVDEALEIIPPYTPHDDDAQPVERSIEGVEHLESYFAALTRTDLGMPGAVTRASHWGDSVLGTDGITGDIRRRLQARFGDAGHGFHALTRYDASYRHQGIRVDYKGEWKRCYIIHKCRDDGHYGLGGVTVSSAGGAETVFRTADKGPVGRRLTRFELWYAGQPRGGRLRIAVDGGEAAGGETHVIETAAEALEDRWAVVELDDGEHSVSVRAIGGGPTRAYGVVLERDRPGVVWEEMALIGAFTSRFTYQDPDHLARQLARRRADLLVFTFGGNDLQGFSPRRFRESFDAFLTLVRGARPEAACLVTSVIDHGERSDGGIVSVPGIERMVDLQRELALAHGCAFFDLWTAMGGRGSMGRWHRASPRLASGDLHHLTHRGHAVVGGMIYRALMEGYRDYRARVAGTPVATLEGTSAPEAPELSESADLTTGG